MNTKEVDALHARLKAVSRRIDDLVIDGMPRQNKKATEAMFACLEARAVADALYMALLRQGTQLQLARMAYMDAAYGCTAH